MAQSPPGAAVAEPARPEGGSGSTNFFEVQHLLLETPGLPPAKREEQLARPVSRPVKRIRTSGGWPGVDHWPMIGRGLLCLARAKVSNRSGRDIQALADVRMEGF